MRLATSMAICLWLLLPGCDFWLYADPDARTSADGDGDRGKDTGKSDDRGSIDDTGEVACRPLALGEGRLDTDCLQ